MAYEPITAEELREVWRRLVPRSYSVPLEQESNGAGFDGVSQLTEQLGRASEAVAVTTQAYYLRQHSEQARPPAAGERRALVSVEVSRTAPADYPIVFGADPVELDATRRDGRGEEQDAGRFRIMEAYEEEPTVAGSTALVLVFAAGTFVPGEHVGRLIRVGSGEAETRTIVANTATTITLDTALAAAPAVDTLVRIWTSSIPFGALGPVVLQVECTRAGYQGNVAAGSIERFTARGEALIAGTMLAGNIFEDGAAPSDRLSLGMPGQYARIVTGAGAGSTPRRIRSVTQGSPASTALLDGAPLPLGAATVEVVEFADLGLSVEQPEAATGGRHGWLDAIATDRGTGRAPGEGDEALRLRLQTLDDIISPAAIERIADAILTPLGIRWRLMETRDPAGLPGFVLDLDPFDRGTLASGEVWLADACGAVRFFILAVSAGGMGEFGAPYDSPFAPGGNAWDVLVLDGYAVEYLAALAALWDTIDRARAAGVCWALVLDETL